MGSSSSRAERLEELRIQRERRLGVYGQPTSMLYSEFENPSPQPIFYNPNDWFPARRTLAAPPRGGPSVTFTPVASPQRRRIFSAPPPPVRIPQPKKRPVPAQQRKCVPKKMSSSTIVPFSLGWNAGTTAKKFASGISASDILGPASKTHRSLLQQEEVKPRKKNVADARHCSDCDEENNLHIKPILMQALLLLRSQEVEDRAFISNEEVNELNYIGSAFNYGVEMETIRMAAFELFYLQAHCRRAVAFQEKRERKILMSWSGESYEDAKLTGQIRNVQARHARMSSPGSQGRCFIDSTNALPDHILGTTAAPPVLRNQSSNSMCSSSPVMSTSQNREQADSATPPRRVAFLSDEVDLRVPEVRVVSRSPAKAAVGNSSADVLQKGYNATAVYESSTELGPVLQRRTVVPSGTALDSERRRALEEECRLSCKIAQQREMMASQFSREGSSAGYSDELEQVKPVYQPARVAPPPPLSPTSSLSTCEDPWSPDRIDADFYQFDNSPMPRCPVLDSLRDVSISAINERCAALQDASL